ncbi:MAG TPA: Imm26 family immunity protein [Candidatus Nanopelagicales bacterium]|nr:Imm26 family immunity protein [Candidatus Nanopelagicales bacterium]
MKSKQPRSKRSKVPDYESMVPAGTIFGIPIEQGKFAFGRVLSVAPGGLMLVEVFRKSGSIAEFDDTVIESGFAAPPFQHTVGPIIEKRWRMLRRGERFELVAPESEFEFVYGAWPFWHAMNSRHETVRRDIPAEEAARRISTEIRSDSGREERVAAAIREGRSWRPGEPDPEWAAFVWRSVGDDEKK